MSSNISYRENRERKKKRMRESRAVKKNNKLAELDMTQHFITQNREITCIMPALCYKNGTINYQ